MSNLLRCKVCKSEISGALAHLELSNPRKLAEKAAHKYWQAYTVRRKPRCEICGHILKGKKS